MHALIGRVMSQADHAPRGTNIALRCWEIRNELEAFGAGDDPDVLANKHDDRPMGELLEASVAGLGTGRGPDAQALEGFIRGEHVTETFSDQVRTVVGWEQIAVSARLLMSTLSRPYPVEAAAAGQRGRWVPLPADSPPAQALLDSTAAAHRASGEMVAMVRARDMHAHNFPNTRAFGQGTSTDASAMPTVLGMEAAREPGHGLSR
ncbi:hypothetical protein [Calidifontibacter indicus]|uniref:Uncharacterized protein n=1 Tax=Calidifontibacter indicus TaxID=419650 RepID=A0A3D9UF96_9MICO|nr:hypothetical protein [Calidifontibacter indicus]REF24624.1 hypothetical protein DFJ65_3410 [Calidifontibacter indicus]